MHAHEITTKPTLARPANAAYFHPRMRGFDITCRLPGGHETVVTTIAADSTIAIDHCHDAFECVIGVTVRTL